MPFNDFALLALTAAPAALFDLLACAALGATLIAFACECAAAAKRAPLMDKFAQQVANLAFFALLVAVAATALGGTYLALEMEGAKDWALDPASPAVPLAASMGFTLFALALYRSTWRNLRQGKGGHLYIGALACLGALGVVYTAVVAARAFAFEVAAATPVALTPAQLYAPGQHSLFWPLLAGSLFLCLCYGGATGMRWLVLRRTRDDFGRDYYNTALPRAARWALLPLLPLAACMGWAFAALPAETSARLLAYPLVCWAGAALVLFVLAACAWLVVALAKLPMRAKWAAMLGLLLLWAMHTITAALFLVLTPLA